MVMFFLPTQLTQIFPDLAPYQIGLLNAVPAALKMTLTLTAHLSPFTLPLPLPLTLTAHRSPLTFHPPQA